MNSPTATTSRLSPLLRQAYRPKPAPAKQISRQSHEGVSIRLHVL